MHKEKNTLSHMWAPVGRTHVHTYTHTLKESRALLHLQRNEAQTTKGAQMVTTLWFYHNVKKSLMMLLISLTLVYGFAGHKELSKSDTYIECGGVAEANVFCLLCSCLWSLQLNFCQSMTATGFSDVPSLLIPSTALPLHCRFLKFSMASTPWPLRAKFMKETGSFHLELIGSQRNVPKTTLDIWYLKMILTEFRI